MSFSPSRDTTRRAFTLVELLVAMAIIAALVGLLLPAVQSAREAARRVQCRSNLKQIALAAHSYHDANGTFPQGMSPMPSQASSIVSLLPFLEQRSLYDSFNFSQDVTVDRANFTAGIIQVNTYLCPSDPSTGSSPVTPPLGLPAGTAGKSNYFANLGAHGWVFEQFGAWSKNSGLAGVFASTSQTRLASIVDGTSATALYAEIRRGAAPLHDALDLAGLPPAIWGTGDPSLNPNNISPPPGCNTSSLKSNVTGLTYQKGALSNSLYTHTVPPNYPGPDCATPALDQGHIASRSAHSGGVHVAMADGSVRFISDHISIQVWRALGTRYGQEIIDAGSY